MEAKTAGPSQKPGTKTMVGFAIVADVRGSGYSKVGIQSWWVWTILMCAYNSGLRPTWRGGIRVVRWWGSER